MEDITQKKNHDIDRCLVEEIQFLWSKGIVTTGSCCGHGIQQGMINVVESSVEQMMQLGYAKQDVAEGFCEHTFIPKSKHC